MNNMLKDCAIDRVSAGAAAGTTDVTDASSVDMAGWDGVLFIASLGTLTATQVTALKAYGSTDDSTFVELEATTAAAADTDSDLALVLDVVKPTYRYLRATLDRGTANAVLDGIIAIRYRGSKSPVTQGATIAASALFASPAAA